MNTKAFLSKLNSVAVMARDGATPGERAAGRAAIGRLLERARADSKLMRAAAAQEFLGDVITVARTAGVSAPSFSINVGPTKTSPAAWPTSGAARGTSNRNVDSTRHHPVLDMYL